MQTIVNGLAVEYADEGTGPALLFLHGWKDSLHTFDALVAQLSKSCRVVRMDLPGFGGSQMPPDDWRLDDYVRVVRAFIEKQQLEVHALIGHSLGGRIAIKGIATGMMHPRKVVLIASAGIAKRKTVRNDALRIGAKIGKLLTSIWPLSIWQQKLRRRMYEHIGSDYFAAGALKNTFLNIIEEDLQSSAERMTLPVLLIWGSNDQATPVADGERLRRMISGSRLEVLGGAGHFVHRERAGEVVELVRTFI